MSEAMQIQLLKPAQVAKSLQIGLTSVYRLIEKGELKGVKFAGRTVRIKPSDLEEFINKNTTSQA